MKRMFLGLVLFLLPNVSMAGPDSTTNALMEETPSMLDFGIMRLESQLNSRFMDIGYTSVDYNWDANRIIISQYRVRPLDELDAKVACGEYIKHIRNAALVVDGKPINRVSIFADKFVHTGYTRKLGDKKYHEVLKELGPVEIQDSHLL